MASGDSHVKMKLDSPFHNCPVCERGIKVKTSSVYRRKIIIPYILRALLYTK